MACCVRKQIHMMPPFKKAEISLDVAEKGSKIKNTWACVWIVEDFLRSISQEYGSWNHMG